MKLTTLVALLSVGLVSVSAQDYQEYQDYSNEYSQQDNLYADYESAQDPASQKASTGGSFLKTVAIGGAGWLAGAKIHSARTVQKMKTKHMKDQKNLYSQYYNDVYTLKEQNGQLIQALEQMGVAVR